MAGRRRRVPDIDTRMASLKRALAAGGDRLEPDAVKRATATVERAEQRIRLGTDHTVVALVGSTGSGKSTLFNVIAGRQISESGVRRPTTAKPFACVWGGGEADPILDWLDVPEQRRTFQHPMPGEDHLTTPLHGLVLLDMPDHDSTVLAHRLEVDRLVELVDLLVWVVDPQKYADDALHTDYLQKLTGNTDVMLVVLNQVDRLGGATEPIRSDLRRLLDADGLEGIDLLAVSAVRGDGVADLRARLGDLVADHTSIAARVDAALSAATADLMWSVGEGLPLPRRLPGERELEDALVGAAAVPAVLDAVSAEYGRQAWQSVGWPVARWLRRIPTLRRRDSLQGLRLGVTGPELRRITASSAERSTPAQRARVDLAVHDLVAAASESLPPRWAEAVGAVVHSSDESLVESVDAAVGDVDLHLRPPVWWRVMGFLQVVGALMAIGGLLWLAAYPPLNAVADPDLDPTRVHDVGAFSGLPGVTDSSFAGLLPASVALLTAGLVLGAVLTLLGWIFVRSATRNRRTRISASMRHVLQGLARQRVILPVRGVLTEHLWTHQALTRGR